MFQTRHEKCSAFQQISVVKWALGSLLKIAYLVRYSLGLAYSIGKLLRFMYHYIYPITMLLRTGRFSCNPIFTPLARQNELLAQFVLIKAT